MHFHHHLYLQVRYSFQKLVTLIYKKKLYLFYQGFEDMKGDNPFRTINSILQRKFISEIMGKKVKWNHPA